MARSIVRTCLADWGQESAVDAAVLLASEVVTNAVEHGGGNGSMMQLLLRVESADERVRIEVHDESAAIPTVGELSAVQTSGRGMILVDAISSGWGVIPSETGKIVWFEIER